MDKEKLIELLNGLSNKDRKYVFNKFCPKCFENKEACLCCFFMEEHDKFIDELDSENGLKNVR